MADIFLSYAEEDRERARQIADLLELCGWSVWWDRKVPAGKTWRQVLEESIHSMRCMVVLWSHSSIESRWVYEEAEEGYLANKLLPALIERVKPPLELRSIQAADLIAWDGSAEAPEFHQLLSSLESMLGKPGAAPPAPLETEKKHTTTPKQKATSSRALAIGLCVIFVASLLYIGRSQRDDYREAVSTSLTSEQEAPSIEQQPEKTESPSSGKQVRNYSQTATPANSVKSPKKSCEDIIARAQLSEPLSEKDKLFLQQECRKK